MQIFQALIKLIGWIFIIAVMGGLFYLALLIKKAFNQERVVESWSALFDGANGEGEKVIKGVVREIERVEVPNIYVTRKKVRPGEGFIGKPREFLVAEHRLIDTYDMYIGAHDYGKQLFVSWYLVAEPMAFLRMFKRNPITAILKLPFLVLAKSLSKVRGDSGDFYSKMNLFDREEITAYITTVHHAVTTAAKEVAENRNIDFSKVDTRTRGFLNLS